MNKEKKQKYDKERYKNKRKDILIRYHSERINKIEELKEFIFNKAWINFLRYKSGMDRNDTDLYVVEKSIKIAIEECFCRIKKISRIDGYKLNNKKEELSGGIK